MTGKKGGPLALPRDDLGHVMERRARPHLSRNSSQMRHPNGIAINRHPIVHAVRFRLHAMSVALDRDATCCFARFIGQFPLTGTANAAIVSRVGFLAQRTHRYWAAAVFAKVSRTDLNGMDAENPWSRLP